MKLFWKQISADERWQRMMQQIGLHDLGQELKVSPESRISIFGNRFAQNSKTATTIENVPKLLGTSAQERNLKQCSKLKSRLPSYFGNRIKSL
jgi:hypothetical protein